MNTGLVKLDEKEVIKYFSRKESRKDEVVSTKSITTEAKSKLKPDRSKNIEIILRKMKLTEKDFSHLEEAFMVYDSNFINEDLLTGLQNVMPNPKEKAEFP